MKIFVTGTRGIPDIPGGVEKHCQELYPRIVENGHDVTIATRKHYVEDEQDSWQGVNLKHIFAPHKKSLEAIVHTVIAVIHARFSGCDIIHIHAVGPGLMVPFARLLGLKVVWTNHGPDYDRGKWGKLAKRMLRLGEWCGGRFANERIVISTIISDIVEARCGRFSHLIYNGVTLPQKSVETDYIEAIALQPGKYLFTAARFVPEKGLHDLLEAFSSIPDGYKLVIAGDADHETEYSRKLKVMAKNDDRVVLTGYITGEKLNQVFTHAGLFVLPSYHEGLPIALLEAMSYDLPVLVSDIPANLEVQLPHARFFRCGDVGDLKKKIGKFLDKGLSEQELKDYRSQLQEKYNWGIIARQTIDVYLKCFENRPCS